MVMSTIEGGREPPAACFSLREHPLIRIINRTARRIVTSLP
jgi:hypothetical protein